VSRRRRWGYLLAIVLVALLLRAWAVLRLPVDYDEPVYLQAGLDYARALRAGDWNGIIDYAQNREHPALVKVLYGLVLLRLGPDPGTILAGLVSRSLSALFGVLAVLVLGLAGGPLAGGLLAVHTMAVKYTGQVYLEALPMLTSLAAVLAFARVRAGRSRDDPWFWLSALALGATAAGKFTYLPVLFPLLYLAIWEKRIRWPDLLLHAAATLGTFWLLNPTLWHDPLGRLFDSLFFHARYSQGARVEAASLPWYQPLVWISRSSPSLWHPDVFIYPAIDGLIFLLALPALYWEWRERRWVVVWVAGGLLFLLLWPTKWPQYTLVLTPALCLAASSTLTHAYRWLHEQETYYTWLQQMLPRPPLSFFIILALTIVVVAAVYTSATLELTLGRIGWSHLTTEGTMLPSSTVYDLLAGPEGEMVLATDRGAAIWSPPPATDLPDRWLVLTGDNSGLPEGHRVQALARDQADHIWFGAGPAVARYDGTEGASAWRTYRYDDMGLRQGLVQALEVGSDGRLWVGTSTGAAALEGQTWTSYSAETSGLVDNNVLSLAVQPQPGGDWIWFGTRTGVGRLDTASDQWSRYTQPFDPNWGGVVCLLVDSAGRLWAGTIGGGLGVWDGAAWQFYRTSNSDIPFNTIQALAEVGPGVIWAGAAPPTQVGGVLVEFDGEAWKTYTPQNSGFSGAEPLAIARDAGGRWWIGTRTAGVDIYQPER